MSSKPPPPGLYVPAVLFFDEEDYLDLKSIKAHVLRLAEVHSLYLSIDMPLQSMLIGKPLDRRVSLAFLSKDLTGKLSISHIKSDHMQSVSHGRCWTPTVLRACWSLQVLVLSQREKPYSSVMTQKMLVHRTHWC